MFLSKLIKQTTAHGVSKVLPKLAWDSECYKIFEKNGFHVMPNSFYYPEPETTKLNDHLWERESELIGMNLNTERQISFLKQVIPKYQKEMNFPENDAHDDSFYLNNNTFGGGGDAEVLHSMIRHFKPKRVIEIGSGFSTRLSARACLMNKEKDGVNSELYAIEPYPNESLKKGFAGLTALIQKPLEDVDLDFFRSLDKNDILFIDSSHVLKIGGDVRYEYLEILPRLKNGVIVHSHDIFFPGEYPKPWILDNHWFWTEQYLVQAFLAFNSVFEILWAGQYMSRKYPEAMKQTLHFYRDIPIDQLRYNPAMGAGSLWIQRKTND